MERFCGVREEDCELRGRLVAVCQALEAVLGGELVGAGGKHLPSLL